MDKLIIYHLLDNGPEPEGQQSKFTKGYFKFHIIYFFKVTFDVTIFTIHLHLSVKYNLLT